MSRRFLSVLLVLVILVSSVGIAQVTHICKMALTGMEKVPCEDESADLHSCCSTEQAADESCCSNKIAVFKSEITSTTQPVLTAPIPAILALLELFQFYPESCISFECNRVPSAYTSGLCSEPIFIEFQSLLI